MTFKERIRKLLGREPNAAEVKRYSEWYTSNFGKQRLKPADKMRRQAENK